MRTPAPDPGPRLQLRIRLVSGPTPGWLWTALAVAVLAHLIGLYNPGEPVAVELVPYADKVFHFVGFAVPSSLAVLALRHWWPIAAFAVNALVSEIVQYLWLPGRDGDLVDLLADLTGLLPAVALWWWLQRSSAASAESSPTSLTSAPDRRPDA